MRSLKSPDEPLNPTMLPVTGFPRSDNILPFRKILSCACSADRDIIVNANEAKMDLVKSGMLEG